MTRLDDLLTYDDEPRRRSGGRSGRGLGFRIAVRIAVTAAVSWALWLMLMATGVHAPYILVFGVVATLVILRMILARLEPGDLPSTLRDIPRPPRSDEPAGDDGIQAPVRNWQTRLEWTQRDLRRFRTVTQPALAAVVEERLRLAHGVSMASDPDRARLIISPDLWRFIHEPVPRSPTPQQLAVLIVAMEAL